MYSSLLCTSRMPSIVSHMSLKEHVAQSIFKFFKSILLLRNGARFLFVRMRKTLY